MKEKECTKCHINKPLEEFHKKKESKDGRKSICKKCSNSYKKKYYSKNKERLIKKAKKYASSYEPNFTEKICKLEGCTNLVQLTPYEVKTKGDKYCSNECKYKGNRKSPFCYYLNNIRKRAKKKEFECNLTTSYIETLLKKQEQRCAISNVPIYLSRRNEKTELNHASLDRIDSSKGYIEGNVQWVMLGINYMKLNFPEKDLHKILSLIKDNY